VNQELGLEEERQFERACSQEIVSVVLYRNFDHQLIICDLVKLLMYGFGDVANPAADSIAVMDDLVIDYITEMVKQYINIIE
jgi:hypothetical protein